MGRVSDRSAVLRSSSQSEQSEVSVDIGSIAMNNEPKTGLTDFSEKVVCFYRGSLSSSKNASVALQELEGGVALVAVTDTRNISCFSGVQRTGENFQGL